MLAPSQAQRLGADAFVFGFPLLLMSATMQRAADRLAPQGVASPINSFVHLAHFPDPSFRAIVGANAHTLYSFAWLDLAAEPIVLDLPDTGGRSYLVSLLDAWSNAFSSLGPGTTDSGGGAHAIVGPGWTGELPDELHRLDAPTNCVWAICHLHAASGSDLDAVRAIQAEMSLMPLSAHGSSGAAHVAIDPAVRSVPSPHDEPMEMRAEEFLNDLAAEMGNTPPNESDASIVDRLATLGLRPGMPFTWMKLPEEIRAALEAGLTDGKEAVEDPPRTEVRNGWYAHRGVAGTIDLDYLDRARVANVALGVSRPEDAVFPLTATDGDGDTLNGTHRYVLRFDPGELPPVEALWSLGLYDMDQLPVCNPIDRYALGNRDELELGADGGLEIAIQRDCPNGSDANWLPAPDGDDFNLILHMYQPGRAVLDGSWTIPPVQRVA